MIYIEREAAKISSLSSSKVDKFEFLTGEKMLPSNQRQTIQQTKFAYSHLVKAFRKETETQFGLKQIEGIFGKKYAVQFDY